MPTYVLFNTIHDDGTGDFTHFEEIMKALLANPRFSGVEFIPIVSFAPSGKDSNYLSIKDKMEALGIPFYYGKNEDHQGFIADATLQSRLAEAEQIISISMDNISPLYMPYFKKDILIKGIGEHEGLVDSALKNTHGLGLANGRQGIKINDCKLMEAHTALSIISENDHAFSEKLLKNTSSPDFNLFISKNSVIPAYFNQDMQFMSFLHFIGSNHSLSKEKDLIVYHSGTSLVDFLSKKQVMAELLKGSNIKRVEIIKRDGSLPEVIETNPLGSQNIKIFSGFYLSDASFNAIYQLANIAGVSGDNTFERCVSMNILPYYYSTNFKNKIPGLRALQYITQLSEVEISPEARQSFNIYFDFRELCVHTAIRQYLTGEANRPAAKLDKFPDLNVPKMIESWPKITAYLRQHKNFYNNLEHIVLENLPAKALPVPSTQNQHAHYEDQSFFKPPPKQCSYKKNDPLDTIEKKT